MKTSLVCLAILAACGVASTCLAHDSVEAACTDLVLNYAYHRDRLDADEVANLFTENGSMELMGERFAGRGAIRQRMLDGKGGPVTRHLMSTIRIFPEDVESARGVSYVTIYAGSPGPSPAAVEGFAAVGEYHDRFQLTPAGWKIAEREFRPAFIYTDQP